MRLTTLLIIFSFIGCTGAPEKPQLELCIIDYANSVAQCGLTSKKFYSTLKGREYAQIKNTLNKDVEEKPLSYLHKAIALTPDNYKLLKDYIDALNTYITEECK